LYALYRLRARGLSVRVYEEGGGVGGTWYWNRYPGARFDSESYTYGYSFSEELLQEWDWKEHYSGQPENERYLNYVADKFDLRRDIRLNSRVSSAVYDEREQCWQVRLQEDHRARAQFLIAAVGVLSAHYVPDFAGLESFQGTWCHTGRWPKDGLEVTGKRVGVIGTGASAVQLIPEIAKDVAHLTVFQRTPNYCVPLRNGPIDEAAPDQGELRTSSSVVKPPARLYQFDRRSAMDISPDRRLEQYERLWVNRGSRNGWPISMTSCSPGQPTRTTPPSSGRDPRACQGSRGGGKLV
jgi:cation diffusion facilitator CzcD-associated flavoprotein CzcO